MPSQPQLLSAEVTRKKLNSLLRDELLDAGKPHNICFDGSVVGSDFRIEFLTSSSDAVLAALKKAFDDRDIPVPDLVPTIHRKTL